MNRAFSWTAIALLLALFTPMAQDAEAQSYREPGSDRIQIMVYGGGFTPMEELGGGEFQNSGSVGATAGIWVGKYFGFRANLLYAQTDIQGVPDENLVWDNPNIWIYNGDFLARLPREVGMSWITPYAFVGAGNKLYNFDNRDDLEGDFVSTFGLGLNYRMDPDSHWGLNVELRDFVSTFEMGDLNETQHDLVWTGGITFSW